MKQSAVAERIFPTDLGNEAEERYLNYALSVITSRALPDVRDGLKPVQRRLLYAMFQNLRLGSDARPRKSAAIVGEVLGKYHPHGDQAAYEAMVRLAQPFSLRYPLVHGEGNFGSLDGDSAAAMRYTEAKLAPLTDELFRDLRGQTVPFRANYDATVDEPVVLPAAIPQLLLNGASGIAVGMATNIPPHNFTEVVNALVAMIDDPDITVANLLKSIKGPDFPTGGEILTNKRELREIYETGQGSIKLRGEWTVETLPRGKRQIVIASLPYTVNKAQLVEKIAELVAGRKLPQVTDVRDESTDDVRIILELKGDASDELVMAYLCKHTSLQITVPVNLTCLVPTSNPLVGQPAKATLRDLCRHFLDFRLEVVTKRLEFELRELEDRLHILAGLALIAGSLDQVIRIIRNSASRKDARDKLMSTFKLDEVQAEAILETRLYQLARLEVEKIQNEQNEKEKRAKEIRTLLANEKKRWAIIRDELQELSKRYGDRRRTALRAGEELTYDPEAYIVHEEATVVLSRDGWIKRVRELKDPTSTRLREGDAIRAILNGTTRDRLALFSNKGVLYVMKVYDVPASTGYGEPIQTLLNFADGERVVATTLVTGEGTASGEKTAVTDENGQGELFSATNGSGDGEDSTANGPLYLLATAEGMGFRFRPNLEETTRNGRKVARLGDEDEVVSIEPVESGRVVCVTTEGRMLAFPTEDVSELTGAGRGVILMRLDKDDHLVGAVTPPPGKGIVVINSDDNERDVSLKEIPLGQRAGKGERVIKRMTLVGVRGPAVEEEKGNGKS
ncbi:MAG: DNA topoisomerase IV subunit A [Deltaproteobacteria bacterium]|nr:DNA topoisomerase IV subunit A [Deltaproteobacteria bacterium]